MLCLFSLVFLLVIPGICSQEWEAQYSSFKKCVLKGLTTILTCIYKHPDNLTAVTQIFWIIKPVKDKNYINLLDHPDYRHRVQYSIKDRTSILTLSNVRREDEGIYCLIISSENLRYYGYPGINLTVTELRVEIPEEVVEKDSPVLICSTTCNLSDKTDFIWYKNGKPLSESSVRNRLFLRSVSSDDTGNYSCAVRDQEHLPSPAVTLSVRYPPQSVSVSVSPSVIMSGDSVTLSCISDSNPPALNFIWFKENETSAVGSGQSFSISSFNSSFSGRFSCEAQNKYGSQRSASVSVSVKESSWSSVTVGITAAVVMTVILTLVVWLLIRRKRVTPSEEQNHRGSRQHVESPVDTYMTLDPKSRLSEYDTLDNMKRSCDTNNPEDKDTIYYNTGN